MPCVGLWLLQGLAVEGAAFQNLDFESSPWLPPPSDPNYPSTIYPNALPGWTVHIGNTVQDGAWANGYILDVPGVALMTLWDPRSPLPEKSVYMQSVALSNFYFPPSRIEVSISQVGDVPSDASYLYFSAHNQWYDSYPVPPGPFEVRLGGRLLSLSTFSQGATSWYGADISPWAGQTTELSIKVLATTQIGGPGLVEGWAYLDWIDIPSNVPEPSVIALIGLGGLLLVSSVVVKRRGRPA